VLNLCDARVLSVEFFWNQIAAVYGPRHTNRRSNAEQFWFVLRSEMGNKIDAISGSHLTTHDRTLKHHGGHMRVDGSALGAITAFAGAYASYFVDGATGGCIVVLQTAGFFLAFVFGPKHGLLATRRANRRLCLVRPSLEP
jgi:hypothetical protein